MGLLALVVLVAGVAAASAQTDVVKPKVLRWESNLSLGYLDSKHIGIVKSFWWFALPGVFAMGPSFDYVGDMLSFTANVALSAPLPIVRPFVCAGAGGSFSGGGLVSIGGGLRIRLTQKFGVIGEFRRYRYDHTISEVPRVREKLITNYFGFGINWLY